MFDYQEKVTRHCCCLITQSCPILCDLMDCDPPGSSIPGVHQARILAWVAFPSPGDLPYPGIKPMSSALAGRFFTTEPPGKPYRTLRDTQFEETK